MSEVPGRPLGASVPEPVARRPPPRLDLVRRGSTRSSDLDDTRARPDGSLSSLFFFFFFFLFLFFFPLSLFFFFFFFFFFSFFFSFFFFFYFSFSFFFFLFFYFSWNPWGGLFGGKRPLLFFFSPPCFFDFLVFLPVFFFFCVFLFFLAGFSFLVFLWCCGFLLPQPRAQAGDQTGDEDSIAGIADAAASEPDTRAGGAHDNDHHDDGHEVFYKDWGSGQTDRLQHAGRFRPTTADTQMLFFLSAWLTRHRP